MRFGDSLARLAAGIVAGHEAREASTAVRAAAVSTLQAATRQVMAESTVRRGVIAKESAAAAAGLRARLAAQDAALGAAVRAKLATARQEMKGRREVIIANAKVLRDSLGQSRRDGSTQVTAFRARVRSERSTAAKSLHAMLSQFVAGVRGEAIVLQRDTQSQLYIARRAWQGAVAPLVTPVPTPEAGRGTSVTMARDLEPVVEVEAVSQDTVEQSGKRGNDRQIGEPESAFAAVLSRGFARPSRKRDAEKSMEEGEGVSGKPRRPTSTSAGEV